MFLPVNADHPWISVICPVLSLIGVGVVMMVLCALGFDGARRAANVCGFVILLPLVTGVALLHDKHWEFNALTPVVATSPDGQTYRDGCALGDHARDSIRHGGYPGYFYRWYAAMIAIVVVGELWERSEKRARTRLEARFAERRRR